MNNRNPTDLNIKGVSSSILYINFTYNYIICVLVLQLSHWYHSVMDCRVIGSLDHGAPSHWITRVIESLDHDQLLIISLGIISWRAIMIMVHDFTQYWRALQELILFTWNHARGLLYLLHRIKYHPDILMTAMLGMFDQASLGFISTNGSFC